MDIKSGSKVEIGVLGMVVGALVWLLTHILPTEAKVESHEKKIVTLEQKVDVIYENTNYIKGQLDGRGHK